MKFRILSSRALDETKNYGDCIIIDDSKKLIVYDCGSEEFADKVIEYMEVNNYDKVDIVLSHNDSDHFNGIPKLIESGKVNSVTTLLLLKYLDDIEEGINDNRKNRESIKKHISELYDNIYSLSGISLNDALDRNLVLSDNVKIVGPDKNYFIDGISKHLDSRESDYVDGETIYNALSVQLEVNMEGYKILLTGDSNYETIKEKIKLYDSIQLPHHGKDSHAENIFQENEKNPNIIYLVSDNTGNSNGGSDNLYKLPTSGYRIKNTINGEINLIISDFSLQRSGTLG